MKKLIITMCLGVLLLGCTHLSRQGDFWHIGSAALVLEKMADGSAKLTVANDEAMTEIIKTIRELAERGVIAP